MKVDLTGKTALITGANSGIGKQIAIKMAQAGANVAVHYLGSEQGRFAHSTLGRPAADEVVSSISATGGRTACFEGDLLLPETAAGLVAAVERTFGSVDILINNAAHCELPDTILDVTHDVFMRHYLVNVGGPALLMKAFAKGCSRRSAPGAIVNISTDAARAFSGQVFYGSSKAALEALTRAAALELGPLDITVNAVAPGPVQTGWITRELEDQILPSIPMRRVGTPDDIAHMVTFLSSDLARWITGQVIQVAGGHAL